MIDKDVVIVGGGPAGSSCAWHLARNGVDCLILDEMEFPREKLCAGWIPPSVFNLLELSPLDYPFPLTTFNRFHISFPLKTFQLPVHQYAIRRVQFDHWLLKHAGVDFEKHRVGTVDMQDGRYIIDGYYSCKYLVGAAGTHCPVYKKFFSEKKPRDPQRLIIAMEDEFEHEDMYGDCHLWFFREGLPGYSWYVPKADGFVNIGIGASSLGLQKKGKSIKDHWHDFLKFLGNENIIPSHQFHPKGHSYFSIQNSLTFRNADAFIIGDSAGLATRDMGEGIRPAIQSGISTADAIMRSKNHSIDRIPRFSFPSILMSGLRKSS